MGIQTLTLIKKKSERYCLHLKKKMQQRLGLESEMSGAITLRANWKNIAVMELLYELLIWNRLCQNNYSTC
eukprot:m.74651 g.74651  ORF g.74651 m.74651 type:complete len:71 (+) comp12472_c0_seq1:8475-8687(+)